MEAFADGQVCIEVQEVRQKTDSIPDLQVVGGSVEVEDFCRAAGGFKKIPRILTGVVLSAQFGPMRPSTWPCSISRLTLLPATIVPNPFRRFSV